MSDNKNNNNSNSQSQRKFSYQPTEQRSYQPTNSSASGKNPKPPKVKSAEK